MNANLSVVAIQRNLIKSKAFQSQLLRIRPQQHVQVRHFPWVPSAYRRGAARGALNKQARGGPPRNRAGSRPLRGRTPPARRKRNRDREATASHRNGGRRDHSGSIKFYIKTQKEALVGLQKELEGSLHRYRESLGEVLSTTSDKDDNENATKDKQQTSELNHASLASSPQVTALLAQLASLHGNQTPESWKHVENTEEGFREVCNLVNDMIKLSTKIQRLILKELYAMEEKQEDISISFYCGLAEQLLFSLIEIQSSRLRFIESAPATSDSDNNNAPVSWFGWLTDKVLQPTSTENSTGPVTKDHADSPPMAHEDPLCGPRLEHFQNVSDMVLRTLREEIKDKHQSLFRTIQRPRRLQQLLERMPPNVVPDVASVKALMNAYALVGSYESARACEKVAEKYSHMQDEVFGTLLHAYYMAAKSSPKNKERSKAALRAEELVRQKWAGSSSSSSSSSSDTDQYDAQKFVHCTKALLCLNAIGTDAMPDRCKRAEFLVEMCIERANLEEVFRNGNLESLWKIAPTNLTLPLLNCLVLIYASSSDPSRVDLAKRLLKILLEDSDFKANEDVPFPDIRTCQSVLTGLLSINDRRIRWTRAAPRGDNASIPKQAKDSSQENLAYGIELLDLMFARSQCWPDQYYFHSLLRLLILANQKGAGAIAEDILTKMHLRESFENTGRPIVSKKTYHYVLRAWLASAEAGDPGAAKKAVELLDFMEAQSLSLFASPGRTNSMGFPIYNSTVTPDRSTTQLVLKICSAIRVVSEKEEALDIALAVHKRIKKRGIRSLSDTYSLLFTCCTNLLPANTKRRQQVTQQLLEDARNQGNVNESVLQRLKGEGQHDDSDGEPNAKPSSSGLLADLT